MKRLAPRGVSGYNRHITMQEAEENEYSQKLRKRS